MKRLNNNNKAITLIALVITIVVLIILASVAISMTLGNNGIFNRAKTAKEQYQNAQELEESTLSDYEEQIATLGADRYSGTEYDILWSWESKDINGNITQTVTKSGTITLNNNIENYKYLIVFAKGYYNGWGWQTSTIVNNKITNNNNEYANTLYDWNNAGYCIAYGFTASNVMSIAGGSNSHWTNKTLTEVWGMK